MVQCPGDMRAGWSSRSGIRVGRVERIVHVTKHDKVAASMRNSQSLWPGKTGGWLALSTLTRSSCSRCRGWHLHAHDKHSACNDHYMGDATSKAVVSAALQTRCTQGTVYRAKSTTHSCSALPCHPPSCDSPTAAACAAPRMGNMCAAWTTLSPLTGEAAWLATGAAAGEAPAAASSGGTCLQQKTRHLLGCAGITC